VRIKSILAKYAESGNVEACQIQKAQSPSEKALMLEITKFNNVMENAYDELAPHKVCAYIYDLSNAFNRFYHETKILSEEDAAKKNGYIALLVLAKKVLESCIDVLGFEAPERM
jgi:arginyl-tRNA synthetase